MEYLQQVGDTLSAGGPTLQLGPSSISMGDESESVAGTYLGVGQLPRSVTVL